MRISDWSSDVCSSDLISAHSASPKARPKALVAEYIPALAAAHNAASDPIIIKPPCPRRAIAPAKKWQLSIMRSEEHTSELQSLMRISYAVFCLKKKKIHQKDNTRTHLTIIESRQ